MPMANPTVPNPFTGVWQRHYIQFDQGPKQTAQSVMWIQGQSAFADVRSGSLPDPLTRASYRTMTWRQRFDIDLLGFAGHFTWEPTDAVTGVCTWHHTLAITPRSRPDTSRYQWLNAHEFLELGTCQDDQGHSHTFVEHWNRVETGPITLWHMNLDTAQGLALTSPTWAVIVSEQGQSRPSSEELLVSQGFSGNVWHKKAGIWQLQWGSHRYLDTSPPFTPDDLSPNHSWGDWQWQMP
jgi:hypothetical protein